MHPSPPPPLGGAWCLCSLFFHHDLVQQVTAIIAFASTINQQQYNPCPAQLTSVARVARVPVVAAAAPPDRLRRRRHHPNPMRRTRPITNQHHQAKPMTMMIIITAKRSRKIQLILPAVAAKAKATMSLQTTSSSHPPKINAPEMVLPNPTHHHQQLPNPKLNPPLAVTRRSMG